MGKFFRNTKTGKVLSEDEYKDQLLTNAQANAYDMGMTGMDILDDVVPGSTMDEYEEYFEEE
ncbi:MULTISPECIES: hypothetical protein [Enterococcus]|uniref:Uncharacterized protein n=1 Tax=Enterococcus sulfureus ATCC 49903 TaxID=1140003 RepID=S0P666_9ENTE|nr:hypothetical protein [Enterococcus sulfureus]EOT47668.1 hypothetical protein OMY_01042 [Enterococcus sulfureus ATCC 49903]EOT83911.1 hypothetical protein I573_01636 [Enterococcus sulfureus ATCC 49903]